MSTLHWWFTFDRSNEYFTFIASCRTKDYSNAGELHNHHILPKSWFRGKSKEELLYRDSPENTIMLSVEDHVKAHELLYEIYKNPTDLAAVQMLKGNKTESRRLWRFFYKIYARAVNEIERAKGSTVFNNEFQKEMARRSLARTDALEIRSKGGRLGGKTRNKGIAIQKTDRYVFSYNDTPVLCILNCETGGEVLEMLHCFKKTPLERATPLLNGSRKTLYGWSCEKI